MGKISSDRLYHAASIAEAIEILCSERDKLLRSMGLRWDIPIPETCAAVNEILKDATGLISPGINQRIIRRNPLMGVPPRSPLPGSPGYVISNMTFEKALPATSEDTWDWTPVTEKVSPGVEKVNFPNTPRGAWLKANKK